jgi:hypothetical protein
MAGWKEGGRAERGGKGERVRITSSCACCLYNILFDLFSCVCLTIDLKQVSSYPLDLDNFKISEDGST